ncbi:MAG: questin oxidase family protein [Nitrospinae bacterium]|nr:questin oxidase family protein [Nitrospinota bacterium]
MESKRFDTLLYKASQFSPEYRGGFSLHATMTMRAMLSLGASPDRLEAFISDQAPRFEPWPMPVATLTEAGFGAALGDPARLTDWRDHFVEKLRPGGWRWILGEWLPRLAPGIMGAALHGAIRTAYAVMALEEEDTLQRRIELAIALASWGARFQPLPKPSGPTQDVDPTAILRGTPLLPIDRRVKGMIFGRVKPLDDEVSFPAVAAAWKIDEPTAALARLSKTAARLYLANPGRSAISFIHCLTGTHAVRILAPYVGPVERVALLRHLWTAVAALYVADADAPLTGEETKNATSRERGLMDMEGMLAAALAQGDDHVVKYAFSIREENMASPDPAYPLALARWLIAAGAVQE